MKRNTFLRLFAATGALFTTGLTAKAGNRAGGGVRVANGKDRYDEPIHLFEGDTFFTKISTRDTDGDLFAFESTRLAKGGPALHYHQEQDEWFYVLSGEFLVKIGEETLTAVAGDCVFVPRKTHHTFSKTSEGEAKMMIVFQPALQTEAYFKAISQGVLKNMSPDEVAKYKLEHGTVVVGPPLGHLKQ